MPHLVLAVPVIDCQQATVIKLDRARIPNVSIRSIITKDDLILDIPGLAFVFAEIGSDAAGLATVAAGKQDTAV